MAEVATHDPAALMEDLRGFVMDEEREVTYKFLCSNLSISSDLAKRLLYQFVSESEGKVRATFAVSGWNKPAEGNRTRKVVIVKEDQVKETVESMSEVLSAHVFSVLKGPSTPTSGTALWATEHIDKEEMYKASPEVGNSLRDNRHAHIRFSKVVRNLKPRRGVAAAEQPPPQSSNKGKASTFATPGKSAADASASSSSTKDKAQPAPSGPKLSAAEMRMKELASGSTSNKPAPKLSAAELRMKELMSGGGGGGSKAGQQRLFAGKGSSSSKSKKSAFAKPEPKKEEEEEEEDEPAKVEAKPELGFSFDFEKEEEEEKPAKKKGKEDKKSKKESKELSEKEKKKADAAFICDASEEEEEEAEESANEEEEKESKKSSFRKRRRHMLDESDEEEAAPATPVKSKNQYKMALAESDSEEEAGVNKEKGEKGEKAKKEEEEEEEEEEDSGDESDDSHASQHTNASDPGARSPSRRAQDKTAKKGGDTEMDDLDDMPDGKLVITKKRGGAKGGEEEGGKKKKARAKKPKEEGEEEEGEAKPKRRRKKSDDDDEEEGPKKKASRKKAVELDSNQKTLDVSAYKKSPVKDTGPSKRRKKVERTYEDEKGYFVTEEVWVEVSDAEEGEAKGEDAPAASADAKPEKTAALKAAPEKPKPLEKKKSIAKPNTSQSGIMSFFKKQ